jgi:hypothetical protein
MSIKRTTGVVTVGAALLLSLTGCLNMDIDVAVKEDGKTADVTYQLGYDKAAILKIIKESGSESIPNLSKDDLCEQIEESITAEGSDYKATWSETKDECLASYETVPVQYDKNGLLPTREPNELIESSSVTITKLADTDTKVELDFSSLSELNSEASAFTPEELFSSFTTTVSFPGKITGANNQGVLSNGDRTVTWNLDSLLKSIDDQKPLSVTGSVEPVTVAPQAIVVGIVALAAAVAAMATAIAVRRRKRSSKVAAASASDTPVVVADEDDRKVD